MVDGIKMQDVGLWSDHYGVTVLLNNDRLTFGALVDERTGAILDPTRRAIDRGLTFRLVPRRIGEDYRVEVKGSLHKFYNNGEHNADQFTAANLLHTLDELVTIYGIDPFTSKINTVEFGVNVVLPFPVTQILQNLVSYKNKPFTRDTHSKTPYYECRFQRFTVKLYDKGKQRGLDGHLLRVEIKVAKMIYFDKTGVHLDTIADLLNVANYGPLGALLVDTFSKILFDDPTINAGNLTPREREIYQNGRNPRYWQLPDGLPTADRARLWKQRQRTEQQYRALIDRHQRGNNWQTQTTALIGQTWQQLTLVTNQLLTQIDHHRAKWQNLTKPDIVATLPSLKPNPEPCPTSDVNCPLLTDLFNSEPTGEMSTFNPLYSALQPDTILITNYPEPGAVICPVTGIKIECPRPRQRFASASLLQNLYHTDRWTFDKVAAQFLTAKQTGANLNQQCYYMAHNIRNAYSNQFNNPLRRIKKYQRGQVGQMQLPFPVSTSQLTERIQAGIDYRKGTRYEVRF